MARVIEAAVDRSIDGPVDVGIGEDDEGAIAAQLQKVRTQGAFLGDLLAGPGRAGEENAIDALVLD